MTATYIPTVGEHAERALASFANLQRSTDLAQRLRSATERVAAVEFVRACLGLMRKFPMQARLDFASVLPFTHLELELIGRGRLDDAAIGDAIALRLVEWAKGSPISVDDADVHAAKFLAWLNPHLDLWSQRQLAAIMAEQLARDRPQSRHGGHVALRSPSRGARERARG